MRRATARAVRRSVSRRWRQSARAGFEPKLRSRHPGPYSPRRMGLRCPVRDSLQKAGPSGSHHNGRFKGRRAHPWTGCQRRRLCLETVRLRRAFRSHSRGPTAWQPPSRAVLQIADLELERITHPVQRGGHEIALSPKEYALLELLMRNAGQPVSRAAIIEQVWRLDLDTMTNVVDVYINYLRHKVDFGFERPHSNDPRNWLSD